MVLGNKRVGRSPGEKRYILAIDAKNTRSAIGALLGEKGDKKKREDRGRSWPCGLWNTA